MVTLDPRLQGCIVLYNRERKREELHIVFILGSIIWTKPIFPTYFVFLGWFLWCGRLNGELCMDLSHWVTRCWLSNVEFHCGTIRRRSNLQIMWFGMELTMASFLHACILFYNHCVWDHGQLIFPELEINYRYFFLEGLVEWYISYVGNRF